MSNMGVPVRRRAAAPDQPSHSRLETDDAFNLYVSLAASVQLAVDVVDRAARLLGIVDVLDRATRLLGQVTVLKDTAHGGGAMDDEWIIVRRIEEQRALYPAPVTEGRLGIRDSSRLGFDSGPRLGSGSF